MLHLKQLSKEFAGKPLFTDINWHLKKGERVGLVGENGAGKSTLMRIIAGQVEHTGGALQFAKGATVGYLPQDGIVTYGRSLFAEAMSALDELQGIEAELHGLTLQLESLPHDDPGHDEALERLGHLQDEFRIKRLHKPGVDDTGSNPLLSKRFSRLKSWVDRCSDRDYCQIIAVKQLFTLAYFEAFQFTIQRDAITGPSRVAQ